MLMLLSVPAWAVRGDKVSLYNVVWTTPSRNSDGSMPLGNGDLGVNVWAEPNGDLVFYISKTDAWDEHCRLLKLGRVRVSLSPGVSLTGRPFRQELRLYEGEILIQSGPPKDQQTFRIWVDAHHPVIHVEMTSDTPVRVRAALEVWRTEKRELKNGEDMGVDGFSATEPPYSYSDIVRPDPPASLIWYHRNVASLWPITLKHQGLGELAVPEKDPLINRTFGGWMCLYPEKGTVEKVDGRALRSSQMVRAAHLRITCLTAQTPTEEEYVRQLRLERQKAEAQSVEALRRRHRAWWAAFWQRSWLRVTAVHGQLARRLRPMRTNTLPLRIGADSNGDNRFRGEIAEVRIYGRALSPSEIAASARGGAPVAGVISRWALGAMRNGTVGGQGSAGAALQSRGTLAVVPTAPWPDGQSVRFTGDGYLETPHSAALNLTDAVTLEAWVRPEVLPHGGGRIIDKSHAGDSDGYLLDTYPGNSLRLIVADGHLSYDAKLPTDRFTHVAAVFDARTGRKELYVDGKRVASDGGGSDGRPEHMIVSQGYALQRFISACGGRGMYPIKFNGSIFTVDTDRRYDPDFRLWGGCYWFQNTRLPYWPMLASGDYDMMQPLFRMYRNALDLAVYRTGKYFRHGGAYFPETMYFWGAYHNGGMGYGWNRQGKGLFPTDNEYIRYYWSGGLELAAMMLDYYAHTGDLRFLKDTLVPIADAVVAFYDQHYPRDANGKLHLEPSQSLETWWDCVNPLPDIAGLKFVLGKLLELPKEAVGETRRSAWSRLLTELPPLPMRTVDGKRVLAPAEKTGRKSNMENPELYAVFPYRLFGVGKPDLHVARETFARRLHPGNRGWQQDETQAAYLGLTEEARRALVDRFATKHEASRFPAFWGPNFDWVPDQDHGTNGLMALQTMLMQCEGRRILLFPAWPKEWDVEFRLHAPLRTVVEGVYRSGRVERLVVTPASRRKDVEILLTKSAKGGTRSR